MERKADETEDARKERQRVCARAEIRETVLELAGQGWFFIVNKTELEQALLQTATRRKREARQIG
jgi:hypothetical protein